MCLIAKAVGTIVLFVLKLVASVTAFVGAYLFLGVIFALLGWLDTVYADFLAVFTAILAVPAAILAFRRSFSTLSQKVHSFSSSCPRARSSADASCLSRGHSTQGDMDTPLETDADGNLLIRTTADWQKFYAQYTPIRTYYTKVAGVTFKNKDGTDRQSILSRCNNWDEVSLEPFTYRGDPAYAVWTRRGQIGNLSSDDAAMLSTVYADCITLAEIKEITGGKRGQYYGCNLVLTVYQPKSETQPIPEKPDDTEFPEDAELTESLIYAAVDIIFETNQVSVSLLHSRLRCGYGTAARIIVELEGAGMIGPYRGSQMPAILLTRAGWEALNYHYPPQTAAADDADLAFIAEAQWHVARNDDK